MQRNLTAKVIEHQSISKDYPDNFEVIVDSLDREVIWWMIVCPEWFDQRHRGLFIMEIRLALFKEGPDRFFKWGTGYSGG